MVDTAFEVPPEKRSRLAAMYGRPDVIAPGPTVSSEFEAWAKGVNDRLDVSRSYPVDSPDDLRSRRSWPVWHDRRLFSLRPDAGQRRRSRRDAHSRAQDARAHARQSPAGGASPPRHRRACPCPATASASARGWRSTWRRPGRQARSGEFGWSGAAKTHYWVDPQEELVGLFMTQSMMSFDLPELDLRALAYQAIED